MRRLMKPCITTWPAYVPTLELDRPGGQQRDREGERGAAADQRAEPGVGALDRVDRRCGRCRGRAAAATTSIVRLITPARPIAMITSTRWKRISSRRSSSSSGLDPALRERGVQVDDVRHDGRAEDADREQDAVGAVEARDQPAGERARRRRRPAAGRRGSRAARSRAGRRSRARSAGSRASAARGSPNATTAVIRPAANGGTPNSRFSAIAAPTNSARSVAIAIDLRLDPQPQVTGRGKRVAAQLGQVAARGDADLGRQVLHEHRHQVRGDDHPDQQVAVLGAAGDVGGEVAGVDVRDGGDERRARAARAGRGPRPWRARGAAR